MTSQGECWTGLVLSVLLPTSLSSMRSHTSWTPTINYYAVRPSSTVACKIHTLPTNLPADTADQDQARIAGTNNFALLSGPLVPLKT